MRIMIVLALLVAHASAEPLANTRAGYADVELDGAIVASAGFVQPWGAHAGWSIDVGSVLGDLDVGDNRVRASVRADVVRSRFRLRGTLRLVRRATANTGYSAQTVGSELVLAPGLSHGRWAGELDFGIEQGWLAHISPTATYRELVYGDASDGWYALPGRTLRLGLAASARIGRVEIVARGGWARHGGLDVLPAVFASVGAAVAF